MVKEVRWLISMSDQSNGMFFDHHGMNSMMMMIITIKQHKSVNHILDMNNIYKQKKELHK